MSLDAHLRLDRGTFRLDAELSVPAGEIAVVAGPSGAGKTTLLRALAGLEKATRGTLVVEGESWHGGRRQLPTHRRPLGYVFQEPSLFPHLTVDGNLRYGARRVRRVGSGPDSEAVVRSLGLGALLDRQPADLSGGERQRVAIGRALLSHPRVLFLDEPVSSLDREGREEVLRALERTVRELRITTLYVTHSADEVARLADRVAWLEAGRIRAEGEVGEILTRLDLPLSKGTEAEAVIDGRVVSREDEFSLNHVDSPVGTLRLAGPPHTPGRPVRLRVRARDVSLTRTPAGDDSSILNIFPVTVTELRDDGDGQYTARLAAGDVPLLASITAKSVANLAVAPGRRLHAQIKSVAVLA